MADTQHVSIDLVLSVKELVSPFDGVDKQGTLGEPIHQLAFSFHLIGIPMDLPWLDWLVLTSLAGCMSGDKGCTYLIPASEPLQTHLNSQTHCLPRLHASSFQRF